jgi:putative hydrolase of the HAD superfamily
MGFAIMLGGCLMQQIKYIFFDCMETIVDLYEMPSQIDYAFWAFLNSGVEKYWIDFNEFLEKYNHSKGQMKKILEQHQEYELMRRFELIVDGTESIHANSKHKVMQILYQNYWRTYKLKCYVKKEIKCILQELSMSYKLAVVSNFMIDNGIEELLKLNQIDHVIDFVATSINVGWRKPNARIYEYSMNRAGCQPDQILFVGDDYENDYVIPRSIGMRSIFLDKKNTHLSVTDRASDFNEIKTMLLG